MATKTLILFIFMGFLLLVIVLEHWRNYWFQKIVQNQKLRFFPPLAELNTRKTAIVYLGLVGTTLFSIFVLAQIFSLSLRNWPITAIISFIVIGSFFLILNLQTVLSFMRKNKQLSFSFLFNPYVLTVTALIITLELMFLYWVKIETIVYFVPPFLSFVGIYSFLILIVALFLSLKVDNNPFSKNSAVLLSLDAIIITLLKNTYLCLLMLTFILLS